MEQGLWGAVIAALITSVVVSIVTIYSARKSQEHAIELQQKQWNTESEWRREDQRLAMGRQIHAQANARTDQQNEWNRQREDREEQRAFDRQREFEQTQLEAIRALEITLPSFSRAARVLYEAKQERLALLRAGEAPPEVDPELQVYVTQFNDLRYMAMSCITKIEDERLRRRAAHLYGLAESMALSDADLWAQRATLFGAHNPILMQVTWLEQLLRMTGRIFRHEPIEGEYVEEHQHDPDLRRSANPVRD